MSQVDYQVAGREAHRYGFGDEEFLRVELYDGYFSIAWSTSLPIGTVFERVEPLLQNIHGEAFVFDERTRAHETLHADQAIHRLLSGDTDLTFARLELPMATLIWEKSGGQDGNGSATFGELAVMARVFDEEACVRMLRETGTTRIAQDADKLVDHLAYIANHVARGHLASATPDPEPT